MNHEIDLAPLLPEHVEHRIDGWGVGDVAMAEQERDDFPREGLDPLLQRIALKGQRDFGARRMAGFRDAPGDGAIVGNTENNPALALHQSRTLRHPLSHFATIGIWRYTSPPPRYSPNR